MPASSTVNKVVWVNSGGLCAMCREHLCEEDSVAGQYHLIGDVAHIVAEQESGPRGNSPLTLQQRNSEPNLILLCKPEHKKVDDATGTYTVEFLNHTKLSHENWVKSSLSITAVWNTKLVHLSYINVPRLSLLASLEGITVEPYGLGETTALHQLGWELNRVMQSLRGVLQTAELKAIPLDVAVKQPDAKGMVVSFDHEFRTKNIEMPLPGQSFVTPFTGDLKKDPHIYLKLDGFKVVANIDRRWITTTTAFGEFRPSSGRHHFAGLGFVNHFNSQAKFMRITPYVIGMPSNPLIEAIYGTG
jgi:hypothetical protein